jgi:hypothetical protein
LSRPEKDRPSIGRAKAVCAAVVSRFNRREHRLVTVLCDGSELVFAPVAFYRSGDHASAAINKPRPDRRRMAASRDLDGDARLDRTVTSITSEPERSCRFPTPEDEIKPDEQALTANAAMSVSSALAARSNDRHHHG